MIVMLLGERSENLIDFFIERDVFAKWVVPVGGSLFTIYGDSQAPRVEEKGKTH